MCSCLCLFFFFSSRRRHTRCSRDWSSDVCSSDLRTRAGAGAGAVRPHRHCRAPPARAARGRDAPQARDGAPRRPRRRVDQGEDERGDGVDRTGGGDRRDRRRAARVTDVVRFLESLPPGPLYGLITALAAIESIFPPVPADTAVALGAFLAGRGVMNAWAVFLLTWVANVGSAAAVYGLGRRYGRDFFQGRLGRKLLPEPVLAHITAQYRRHGTSGIFLSRLLPVWRAVVPPFAGVAGVPPVRALVPLALASGLWYGGLTFFVATASANLQTVLAALRRVNSGLGAVALGVLIFLAVWTVRRLKR